MTLRRIALIAVVWLCFSTMAPGAVLHTEWIPNRFRARLRKNPLVVIKPVSRPGPFATRPNLYTLSPDHDVPPAPNPDIIEHTEIGGISSGPVSLSTSRFYPSAIGVDPMIAVGRQAVIVTQDHQIDFYSRGGSLLAPKNDLPTSLSATDFFRGFWTPKNPNGTPNTNNINTHLGFPVGSVATCDATQDLPPFPCVDEFYDTRAIYEDSHRRFFIISAARNHLWPAGNKYDPLVRRYYAIAVSVSEDPRDGFHQYMVTDSNSTDWPLITANHGTVAVGHLSEPEAGKPAITIWRTDDLILGKANPDLWSYGKVELGADVVLVPVVQYSDTFGMTLLVKRGSPMTVYAAPFRQSGAAKPALVAVNFDVSSPLARLRAAPVYRNGMLYITTPITITPRVPDKTPERNSVRLIRLPLKVTASDISILKTGYFEWSFGRNALSDDPQDLVSYDLPALAVNKNSDMVFVFARIGVQTKKPLFPEVRTTVWRATDNLPQRSQLLQKGNYQPMKVHKNEVTSTATTPYDTTDFGSAVVDPVDDTTVWVTHMYANPSGGNTDGYKQVVGKLKP